VLQPCVWMKSSQCVEIPPCLSHVEKRINRRLLSAAVLTVPEMNVVMVDNTLQVSFDNLPLTATASVSLWKKEHEQKVKLPFPSPSSILFFLFHFFWFDLLFCSPAADNKNRTSCSFHVLCGNSPALQLDFRPLLCFRLLCTRCQLSRRCCTSPPCRREPCTASRLRLSCTQASVAAAPTPAVCPSQVQVQQKHTFDQN